MGSDGSITDLAATADGSRIGLLKRIRDLLTNGVGLVRTRPEHRAGAAGDVAAPAVNLAAVVTYGATAALRHVISGVAWSYTGGIPVGGNLQVADGAAVILNLDIADEGPGFIPFLAPKSGTVNTAMTVTLAAAGAGVTGKVSVLNHWTEA